MPANGIVLDMPYAFALLAVAVSLQLLLAYRIHKILRLVAACLCMLFFAGAAGLVLWLRFGVGSLAITLISTYSIVNVLRVVVGQSDEQYRRTTAARTALWLGLAQVAAVYYTIATYIWSPSTKAYALSLAGLQLIVALLVAANVRRQLRTTRLPSELDEISDGQLPTVTVAVPVRNEAGLLQACLEAALSSNYPKLEILAFDDQSRDKTPDIIRSFAHAGVRFLRSAEPANGWLAKNQAYHELAKAANGEYILFIGADIQLGVRSIRQLVALAKARNKRMVSVMPLNRGTAIVPPLQAMRYFWEMGPPRRLFNRPPVLSSCWLIERKALQRYCGFEAVRQSMSAEAHLAHQAVHDNDGYSFVRADARLTVVSHKGAAQQRATARLRRYPQVHRRIELVLLYSLGQALLLAGPLVIAVLALPAGWGLPAAVIALAALVVSVYAFGSIQRPVFTQAAAWRAYAAYLPAVVSDIWYLNQSMLLYEFATVTWKDRNVSHQVMRKTQS